MFFYSSYLSRSSTSCFAVFVVVKKDWKARLGEKLAASLRKRLGPLFDVFEDVDICVYIIRCNMTT